MNSSHMDIGFIGRVRPNSKIIEGGLRISKIRRILETKKLAGEIGIYRIIADSKNTSQSQIAIRIQVAEIERPKIISDQVDIGPNRR